MSVVLCTERMVAVVYYCICYPNYCSQFHLYEMSRTDKSINTESGLVMFRGMAVRNKQEAQDLF